MAGKKGSPDVVSFEFRGQTFEASRSAYLSPRVQRGLAYGSDPGRQSEAWRAIDAVCMGRTDEYMSRIPEEDGTVGEYGCSAEAWAEFSRAMGEAISKN